MICPSRILGTVRRFLEQNIDIFDVIVFVVEPIDEVGILDALICSVYLFTLFL